MDATAKLCVCPPFVQGSRTDLWMAHIAEVANKSPFRRCQQRTTHSYLCHLFIWTDSKLHNHGAKDEFMNFRGKMFFYNRITQGLNQKFCMEKILKMETKKQINLNIIACLVLYFKRTLYNWLSGELWRTFLVMRIFYLNSHNCLFAPELSF